MTAFDNLKLSTKIFSGFGIVIALLGLLAMFAFTGVKSSETLFTDYRDLARSSVDAASKTDSITKLRLAVMRYRATEDSAAVTAAREEIARAKDLQSEWLSQEKDSKDGLAAREAGALLETYAGLVESYFADMNAIDRLKPVLDDEGPAAREALTEIFDRSISGAKEASVLAASTQEKLLLGRLYTQKFLLRGEPKDGDRATAEIAAAKALADRLASELRGETLASTASQSAKAIDAYSKALTGIYDKKLSAKAQIAKLDETGPKLLAIYDAEKDSAVELQNQLGPKAQATFAAIVQRTLLIAGIAVILGIGFAFFLGRMISGAITKITATMKTLADGNLSVEIEGTGRGDEIGAMAKAVQVFKDNAIRVKQLQEEQKESELRQKEERRRAMLELADRFEHQVGETLSSVGSAAEQLQATATQLASAVEETNSQSVSVATASEQASANVQTVASAAEELSAAIAEVSRSVANAAELARSSAQGAEGSRAQLDGLRSAIADVEAIIQSINDVADQTNLLALNATIEAARAGEAGKGFAVVASEVKALAGQTRKMTDEIGERVRSVQQAATSAIESTNVILTRVKDIDAAATGVAASVEEQSASTSEISRNVQQAAEGTSEVSRGMQSIQTASTQTGTAAEEVRNASTSLVDHSNRLSSAVERFLKEVRAA